MMRYTVPEEYTPLIKPRPEDSHKGTFGTVAALVGSKDMPGAALLCCEAALRSGAGLLKAYVCSETAAVLHSALPEVICLPCERILEEAPTAYVLGCGCGRECDRIFEKLPDRLNGYAVLDADGINFAAMHMDILKNSGSKLILTPHPGEFARLTGLTAEEINRDREGLAAAFAEKYGCVLVLKGHNTVIADGKDVFVNTVGGSELAKGGSGDVLAGITASLLAQGYGRTDACVTAVYLHGRAGNELRNELGASAVLPSDVLKRVGRLLG